MSIKSGALPVVLIAAARDRSLAGVLEQQRFSVVHVPSGALALEWARDVHPDAIILEADLPDMSGIDACRLLHSDVQIAHNVPLLILTFDKPTPEQRVAAFRAGAWDFLQHPVEPHELSLKLQPYVQAKRNIDLAFSEGLMDPTTGLHSRPGLARRARELGALMTRMHGALACVVFSAEGDAADPAVVSSVLVRTARTSDIVGALSATEFAVIAPGADDSGAVKLAARVADALRERNDKAPGLRVGYDAVANLKYTPLDPVDLLARASTAARYGTPDPDHAWVRRFDGAAAAGEPNRAPRLSPVGMVLENRRPSR